MAKRNTQLESDKARTKTVRWGIAWVAVMATLLPLLQCNVLLAQDSGPSNDARWHLGCELFQMLLEERGVSEIQSLNASLASPNRSVIVLTGDLSTYRRNSWIQLADFVRLGGSLLIASEQATFMNGIGEIKQGPVESSRSEELYLNFKDCLRVKDIDASHPMMLGVNEIISNRASWLSLPNRPSESNAISWQSLASLPRFSTPMVSRGKPLIAISQTNPTMKGVIVLVADVSILSNGMLWHGDNATFAIRLSETLASGGKTKLTFMSGDDPLPSYRDRLRSQQTNLGNQNNSAVPQLEELPASDLETALKVANHVLKNVADSKILNEAMAKQPRPVNPRGYALAVLVFLLVAATLLVLAYIIRRTPVLTNRPTQVPHLSVFQMESNLLNRHSQFGPAAFILAREFCKECSGAIGGKDWQNSPTRFNYSAAIPNDKAFRDKLEYVRSFEISNLVPRVSEKEFLKLGRTIQELREALHTPILS